MSPPQTPTPPSLDKKHKRSDRSCALPVSSHPSSPTSGSKVVLDPLHTLASAHHDQSHSCSCAASPVQQLQQPYAGPFGFPGYPSSLPMMLGSPTAILVPTALQSGSTPSLPFGLAQFQQLQQQQVAATCGSCPIHHPQLDHRQSHHQRSNSDSPTRRRLSKHAPLKSASPPASASSIPTSPRRIAREKSPVHASDDVSVDSSDNADTRESDIAEITSDILDSTVASLVHDLVLVEYAQAKLDQVRTTKQFPWSTSPRDPLAHLAASLLNEVVVQETRHLVRTCIHDAVLAKLKRDATDRACEALIEQCVREVVMSTVVEIESEAAASAAAAESGGIVARGSSEGEADGVQQAGSVLKALVADE
ncbi:hypothetical protein BCR44DRAFT_1429520, partial [Catenaria anguillulae PL171]